jgi:hypothetical protein
MPQAIPLIVYYVAQYYGASALVAALAAAAASYAVGSAERRRAQRAARDAYNASLKDRLVMVSTTDGARSRVYGRVRNVDGLLFKATHGSQSQYYTLVVALAGHEIDAVEQIYFGDVPVTLDANGWVTTAPFVHSERVTTQTTMSLTGGAGSVNVSPHVPLTANLSFDLGSDNGTVHTTGSISGSTISVTGWGSLSGTAYVDYEHTVNTPRARVWPFLGTSSQDLAAGAGTFTGLQARFPSLVTANDKFRGIACLVVELEYDQDVFPTGVPPISAIIRGAKITDPRTSVTGWTENPSVIAYDWARYAQGGAMASSEIVTSAVNAAANACDVSTVFNLAGGSETRPLYQCGIVCKLDASPQQWMDEIVASMAGQWAFAGGKLTLRAGVWRAPVGTLTEDWLSGVDSIQLDDNPSRELLVNNYRPAISDAQGYPASAATSTSYIVVPTPEVRSSGYITVDGQELPREISLDGVTRAVHAQHVAGVLMRDARNGAIVLPCNMRAWPYELFDVLTCDVPRYGETSTREIVGWAWSPQGGVRLTLKKTQATDFNPNPNFSNPVITPNTALPSPTVVPTPTGLAATSGTAALSDGSIITRTEVTWTATTSEAVRQSGRIEVQFTEATATLPNTADWPVADAAGSTSKLVINGLRTKRHYLFRVRAVNTLGVRSQWSPLYVHYVAAPPTKVWRQATDPGSAARENDQWYDTDDGNKHYIREGGVWQPVLAGTGAIATAAATSTVAAKATGNVNLSGGAPGDVTGTICSASYLNDTGATITVQVETSYYDAYLTADGLMTAKELQMVQTGAAEGAETAVFETFNVPPASGNYPGKAMVWQYTLANGNTLSVAFKARVAGTNTACQVTVDVATVRITAIKR